MHKSKGWLPNNTTGLCGGTSTSQLHRASTPEDTTGFCRVENQFLSQLTIPKQTSYEKLKHHRLKARSSSVREGLTCWCSEEIEGPPAEARWCRVALRLVVAMKLKYHRLKSVVSLTLSPLISLTVQIIQHAL